jgi:hypothetical protein
MADYLRWLGAIDRPPMPEPLDEEPGPPPADDAVWVAGEWVWRGAWTWIHGGWRLPGRILGISAGGGRRPQVRDHRDAPARPRPQTIDHRDRAPARPGTRDHRGGATRDHRTTSPDRAAETRDHRTTPAPAPSREPARETTPASRPSRTETADPPRDRADDDTSSSRRDHRR